MIEFHDIGLQDREKLSPLLFSAGCRSCEYSFANLYLYRSLYQPQVAYVNGGALVRYGTDDALLWPLGFEDPAAVIEQLLSEQGQVEFTSISKADAEYLQQHFAHRVREVSEMDLPEYVYNTRDLAELAGKRYHAKRNHCARFERQNPGYRFEVITEQNIAEVEQMNEQWYMKLYAEGYGGLEEDYLCSSGALREFFALGLQGGLLRTDKGVVAWAAGQALGACCFDTIVEKAMHSVEGAYAVINRDFARHFCADYAYINREDDAGDEGLRKAKMSYRPEIILQKYQVTLS